MYGSLQHLTGVLIAQADSGGASQSDPLGMFAPLIIVFGIMYFLVMRPATKERKQHQSMLDALKRGDEIVTSSGILGRVTDISDTLVTIEISRNVKIRVLRTQISKKYVEAKEAEVAKTAKA
jgi:preprotein translocase subunit YajC